MHDLTSFVPDGTRLLEAVFGDLDDDGRPGALLSVMVTVAMKMMAAVTAAFMVKYLLSMPGVAGISSTDGINSMSLQQGGLGLLLTTLILSAPPMAAAFFQGTLGQFQSYSPFGHIKPDPKGGGGGGYGVPGTPSYVPPTPQSDRGYSQQTGQNSQNNPYTSSSSMAASAQTAMSSSGYGPQPESIPQRDRNQ